MKNIQHKLMILLLVAFAFPNQTFSQENLTSEPSYEVNKVYAYISVSETNLKEAQTLSDLNYKYKSSWISEYISVEISTSQNGKVTTALGENDQLTQEQKDHLGKADPNTAISVLINYIPENNLKNKEAKEMDFTFSIDPAHDAAFPDGQLELKQYLKQAVMDKTSSDVFKNYDLAAVKFTVNEDGKITNAHVVESSKDEKVDRLLLATIQNMTDWKPAKYSNGLQVKQDFILTVGNMESCVVNLLGIRRYK
jgi:TonB family protein